MVSVAPTGDGAHLTGGNHHETTDEAVHSGCGGAGLMAGAAAPARADLIATFTAEGTFADGATLGGTLTIDTSIGTVTAANLTVGAPDSLTFVAVQDQLVVSNGFTQVDVGEAEFTIPSIELDIPVTSMVAYAGGALIGMTINQNYGGNTSTLFLPAHGGRGYVELGLQSGSLSVAVPEPSTLLVACVGGVCAIAYGVEKHRRAARTNTRAA